MRIRSLSCFWISPARARVSALATGRWSLISVYVCSTLLAALLPSGSSGSIGFPYPMNEEPPRHWDFDPFHYASDDPAVLYQLEYSHAASPPPSHAQMFAHGPIARPGSPPYAHHAGAAAAPGASLPKLQLIHFVNPVPIAANKFSYVHNLRKRRNRHFGLAPRPYPVGIHAPGFVQTINRLALRAYCAFNGMNAHCLQFYGEHEDWLGGEPYYSSGSSHNRRRPSA